MFRLLIVLVISVASVALVAAGLFYVAGRGAPPELAIVRPERIVGQKGTLEIAAGAPSTRLAGLTVAVEQNGRTIPLFALDQPQSAAMEVVDADRLRVTRPFGKQSVPELQPGPARIVVTASRKSFLNLRTLSNTAAKDVQVQLEPPRIAMISTKHYVNHGGSEMVVYRASPPDTVSGVRVGDAEYLGYPAAGAGMAGADPGLKIAFFALLHDQDLSTPMVMFARDEAGNESTTSFVDEVFPKPFRRSRIELDDRFLGRVVSEILQHSPELNMTASGDLLPAFLRINGELRERNARQIAEVTVVRSAARLWRGPFVQLGNSQVEAGFADHRTYVYRGQEVDQQVHLGFDLAVTAAIPVAAANAGKVLHASWLGIYGNCVIVDHGMGVASLYGHLSSMEVKPGDTVSKGQRLGRSGMTGLAGGDHVHFTVLLSGRPVNPVEWWDPHWIQDRIERKLSESGGPSVAP